MIYCVAIIDVKNRILQHSRILIRKANNFKFLKNKQLKLDLLFKLHVTQDFPVFEMYDHTDKYIINIKL